MTTDKTYLAYFSATHTSRNVGRAVVEGIEKTQTVHELDATFKTLEPITFHTNDLLIVSVPVYGGHVAPIALKRLETLHGNGTPAVAIVVYGNRNFDDAATDLQKFLSERGFNVIAAAAFVGEHSYSTQQYPIAPNRPNAEDLKDARHFGEAILNKLQSTEKLTAADAGLLICPDSGEENLRGFAEFIKSYQAQAKAQPTPVKLIPIVNESLCSGCGSCADVCPTGAIDAAAPTLTDPGKCIKCCACVKNCPEQARSLATPFASVLSKYFSVEKANVFVL